MGLFHAHSIVFLSDGREVYCENTVEELNKEFEENNNNCVKLILSKENGSVLAVDKQQINGYTCTD